MKQKTFSPPHPSRIWLKIPNHFLCASIGRLFTPKTTTQLSCTVRLLHDFKRKKPTPKIWFLPNLPHENAREHRTVSDVRLPEAFQARFTGKGWPNATVTSDAQRHPKDICGVLGSNLTADHSPSRQYFFPLPDSYKYINK